MKPLTLILLGSLVGLVSPLGAEPVAPTVRSQLEIPGWIQFTGSRFAFSAGWVPFSYGIRRDLVTSAVIEIDWDAFHPSGEPDPAPLTEISSERTQNTPALLRITTSEFDSDGRHRCYEIPGLTFATAPEFLQKVLIELAKDPKE
ncbi:hypothetical protein HNR46_001922 [Haloferula luteola]|uniref:Uncharacterized protein n=1 Tax=Haloferula luteola TaxID=595692 RepID=A0A840V2I8_9BACT|nr:hypothetical protein [Haloferula luteola]MBB5351683.1 hypothetical protein [Haloferula luteola]